MDAVRVLIACEVQDSLDRMRSILAVHRHRIEIAGDTIDPDNAAALVQQIKPDVVLLDYRLLAQLRAGQSLYQAPFVGTRVIVIISTPDKLQIVNSFRLGAFGVILEGASSHLWWNSIVAVTRGKYWLEDEPLAVLIQTLRESQPGTDVTALGRHFGLTQREIEIVQKIADGRSNKQVGQDFSIRERTVKHHLTNIFSKMGISNRVELALLARDHQSSPSPTHSGNWLDSRATGSSTVSANEPIAQAANSLG